MSSPPVFYNVENLLPWLEQGVPLITPNQRLARHIKHAYGCHLQAQGQQTWETPAVYSLSQWWQHCAEHLDPWRESEFNIPDKHQELALWTRCVKENPDSANLLRPRSAARLARDAYHNLLLWQVDRTQDSRFRYGEDHELFLAWAERFESLCRQHELTLQEVAIARWTQGCPQQALVLVDFDELAPLYRDYLEQQAQQIHRHSSIAETAQVSLQPCENSQAELAAAASWAAQCLQAEPAARVGILIEDVAGLRLRLERLLRAALQPQASVCDPLPVNFSSGEALSNTTLVSTGLRLLSLLVGEIQVHDLIPLLHRRYRQVADADLEIEAIRALYREGRAVLSPRQLRWTIRDTPLGVALLELSHDRELRRELYPTQWAEVLPRCLTALGWPGTSSLNSQEYQVYGHWLTCLGEFSRLDRVSGPLGFELALQTLEQVCSNTLFQPQTPDSNLQVLGFLEAAGMEFDHLWIVGAGRNSFPSTASPNPYIPMGLQRQKRMPHADNLREYEFSRHMLDRFIGSSRTLVASYATAEDDIEQSVSSLLASYPSLPEFKMPLIPSRWADIARLEVEELGVDAKAPAVDEIELASLRGGSSLIRDQSLCGFRGFVRQRLRVDAPGQLTVSLTAAERGDLMHAAMYVLWGQLGDRDQLVQRQAEIPELIGEAINSAIVDFNNKTGGQRDQVMLSLERSRLQSTIEQWMAVELERGEFQVLAREQELKLEFGRLSLSLRVDRVDQLPDDSIVVVDYKSGKAEVRDWLEDRPAEPQLPLYSYALGQQCVGMSFARVRRRDAGYKGLADRELGAGIKNAEDWQALQQHWNQVLSTIAEAFLNGHAAVDPPDQNTSCMYCGLAAVCRINEAGTE